nr:MAG TPA: hypothetical protein [Caudoviricetes sp.]
MDMKYLIVFVVYGSKSEMISLISFMAEREYCFHYSGEYVYFSYDPTDIIKEANMPLKVDKEIWGTNCFSFREAPKSY